MMSRSSAQFRLSIQSLPMLLLGKDARPSWKPQEKQRKKRRTSLPRQHRSNSFKHLVLIVYHCADIHRIQDTNHRPTRGALHKEQLEIAFCRLIDNHLERGAFALGTF